MTYKRFDTSVEAGQVLTNLRNAVGDTLRSAETLTHTIEGELPSMLEALRAVETDQAVELVDRLEVALSGLQAALDTQMGIRRDQ